MLPQVYDLILNVVIPIASLIVYSLLSYGLVGSALQFRCVPIDLLNPNVATNPYYQAYGMDYFYSEYNNLFCGYRYNLRFNYICVNMS